MSFRLLIESILIESKIDDLKDQYSNHPTLSRTIVDHYHNSLPEGHKSLANLKWMLDRHIEGKLSSGWASDVGQSIAKMNHPSIKPHLEKKQLSQYKDPIELERALAPHLDKIPVKDNSEVVYQSPTLKVTKHPDHKSAMAGAKLPDTNPESKSLNCKASWCVSAEGETGEFLYDNYTKSGEHDMHTVEVTHPDGHTRKYAIIHWAKEYRDEHDVSFNPENFVLNHKEMLKTDLGRSMLGGSELFTETGELKPLHSILVKRKDNVVTRNPIVDKHPDYNDMKVVSHIAENPKKYGKEEAHFAYVRLSNVGSNDDVNGVIEKVSKSPKDYHPYTVGLVAKKMGVDQVKNLARNLPQGHREDNTLANYIGGHKALHPDDIHELMIDKKVPHSIKEVMVVHHNLGPSTVTHIMNNAKDFSTNTKFNAALSSKISREDIHKAVTDPNTDETFRNGAAYNSKMSEDTAKWILDNAERESGGKETHYMNLAANKIRRETTFYTESFEKMVINQFIK